MPISIVEPETTKAKILDAAIDLYASKGYTQTTLREISGVAGIKASSVYNHFESKEAILDAIYNQYIAWMQDMLPSEEEVDAPIAALMDDKPLTPEKLLSIMFYKFPQSEMEKYRKIMRIIYYEPNNNARIYILKQSIISDNSIEYVKNIFSKLVDKGLLQPFDIDSAACLFGGVLFGFTFLFTLHLDVLDQYRGRNSVEDILKYILQLIIDGKA